MTASERQFYEDSRIFVDELLQESPVTATLLGDHRHDDRLGDYTQAALDRQRQWSGQWLKRFGDYDTAGWSLDARIDWRLMVQVIKSDIRSFDRIRPVYRNPVVTVQECLFGVHLLILRDFAPLPVRMKSVLDRSREVPRVLAEGRAIIDRSDVPKVWAEVAIEFAQQGVGLFTGLVPTLAESIPDLKSDVLAAARDAADALEEHTAWMKEDVLPHATGDFAIGEELFDEILREDHMVDYDTAQLCATGWQLYEDTDRQMRELAGQIDPNRTAKELLEEAKDDHPTAEGLLDAYREKMAEARQFVVEHDVVTIPAGESIRIEPTPAFMRPLIPYAGYIMPGFLEELQEGLFMVTPVDEGAEAEAIERKLRGHPFADFPVTVLHEAYPGHHLQLVAANLLGSVPRRLGGFLSPLFVEGWAFYCEEVMEQLGYIALPIQRLARLQAQLWRASRIIIDASLHTGQMTVDEAISFLVERAGLEPDDAKAEVRRYTMSPTQPQSYLMGKLEILRIVDEYKRRYPDTTMRQMHDAILSCGSLPPKLMRLALFGPGETDESPSP